MSYYGMGELLEVSQYAPQTLKNLEKIFARLKRDKSNVKTRHALIEQIGKFTKINDISIEFTNDFNAGVIPIYNVNNVKEVVKTFVNRLSSSVGSISPDDLKITQSVVESEKNIKRIYMFIGKPLLDVMTPAELVSIILHEIGHIYIASTNLIDSVSEFFKFVFNNTFRFFAIFKLYNSMVNNIVIMSTQLFICYQLIVLGLVHGITFTQRVAEYKSDNFAVKYGYGDELINVLNIFGKYKKREYSGQNRLSVIEKWFYKFIVLVKMILNPQVHPEDDARIKNLEKQIFNEYKKLYPNYKQIINKAEADYITLELK